MDPDILSRVSGRGRHAIRLLPARLLGYCAAYRRGALYPIVLAAPGAHTEGRVWQGATVAECRRLARFEGVEYRHQLTTVELASGPPCRAWVFMPRAGTAKLAGANWDFETWCRRYKARYMACI